MAFQVGENTQKAKAEDKRDRNETKDRAERSDRSERGERGERGERRDRRTGSGRARAWSINGADQGRASEFVKEAKEMLKENGMEENTIILQPTNDLARELSENFGFVIYANRVDSDLMWHLLVFESQLEPVVRDESKDRRRSRRGEDKTYEYSTTIDAINDDLVADIQDWLQDTVKVDGGYYFTNATVVPLEVDLESDGVISTLGYDAEDSNFLLADVDTPFSSDMLKKSSILRAQLTFTPNEKKVDLTTMPLRSDFQINIAETYKDRNKNQLRASTGGNTIVSLDGFVEPRWVGQDLTDEDRPWECYTPTIVMSQTNPYHNNAPGGNFERTMLAIASSIYLKEDDAWMKQFETNFHGGSKLSALAYGMEWEKGMPDDLDEIDEDSSAAESWMRKVFIHDEKSRKIPVEFAILVREGGVGYATSKLLLDVASGEPDAIAKIEEVLNNLTNNEFSELYPIRDERDIVAGQVRVPMGYFKDSDGKKAVECVDPLYILNALKDNYIDEVMDYFECMQFDDREFDHDEAMSKMINVINLATDNQFKLKGFGTKIYLVPEFLDALARAVKSKDAGLNMELDSNIELGFRRSRLSRGRRTSAGLTDSPLSRRRGGYTGSGRRGSRTSYRRR